MNTNRGFISTSSSESRCRMYRLIRLPENLIKIESFFKVLDGTQSVVHDETSILLPAPSIPQMEVLWISYSFPDHTKYRSQMFHLRFIKFLTRLFPTSSTPDNPIDSRRVRFERVVKFVKNEIGFLLSGESSSFPTSLFYNLLCVIFVQWLIFVFELVLLKCQKGHRF